MAFGLDYHIPIRTNKNITDTESELYLESITHYVKDIPDNKVWNYLKLFSHLETKLRNTCDRYNHICVPYKFQKKSKNCLEIIALWFLNNTWVEE